MVKYQRLFITRNRSVLENTCHIFICSWCCCCCFGGVLFAFLVCLFFCLLAYFFFFLFICFLVFYYHFFLSLTLIWICSVRFGITVFFYTHTQTYIYIYICWPGIFQHLVQTYLSWKNKKYIICSLDESFFINFLFKKIGDRYSVSQLILNKYFIKRICPRDAESSEDMKRAREKMRKWPITLGIKGFSKSPAEFSAINISEILYNMWITLPS